MLLLRSRQIPLDKMMPTAKYNCVHIVRQAPEETRSLCMRTSGSLCLVPRQHACCFKSLPARPTCVCMLVLGDLEDHSVGFQEQTEDIAHTKCGGWCLILSRILK